MGNSWHRGNDGTVCDEYTVPMPVSGGWAVFEAMTGAAFAPIAVAGGVSIFI